MRFLGSSLHLPAHIHAMTSTLTTSSGPAASGIGGFLQAAEVAALDCLAPGGSSPHL